jgi:hypothetical protein
MHFKIQYRNPDGTVGTQGIRKGSQLKIYLIAIVCVTLAIFAACPALCGVSSEIEPRRHWDTENHRDNFIWLLIILQLLVFVASL